MKQSRKTVLFFILTLCWTGVIFSFSLQPATASAELSGGILSRLLELMFQLTGIRIPPDMIHNLFRKVAHFGEFFILGGFASLWLKNAKKPWLMPLFYCGSIALLDECLQFITGEGRAMRILDMGIDIFGAFAGILLINLVFYQFFRKRSKKIV